MMFSGRQAEFLPDYARRTKRLSQWLGQVRQCYLGKITQLRDFLRPLRSKNLICDRQSLETAAKWQQLFLRKLAFAIGRPETAWQDKAWLLTGLKLLHEPDAVSTETIDLARALAEVVSRRDEDQRFPGSNKP